MDINILTRTEVECKEPREIFFPSVDIFQLHPQPPQPSPQFHFSDAETIATRLSLFWQSLKVMPCFLLSDTKPVASSVAQKHSGEILFSMTPAFALDKFLC